MAALDLGLLLLLLLSLLLGAWRGLVFEALSLAGWVVAFFVARFWAVEVGALLPLGAVQAAWRPVAGFGLLFIATVFACGLLAALARRLMVVVGLRPADRALGAIFGLVRGVALLWLLAWLAAYTPLVQEQWWQESRIAMQLGQVMGPVDPELARGWMQRLPWQGGEHLQGN